MREHAAATDVDRLKTRANVTRRCVDLTDEMFSLLSRALPDGRPRNHTVSARRISRKRNTRDRKITVGNRKRSRKQYRESNSTLARVCRARAFYFFVQRVCSLPSDRARTCASSYCPSSKPFAPKCVFRNRTSRRAPTTCASITRGGDVCDSRAKKKTLFAFFTGSRASHPSRTPDRPTRRDVRVCEYFSDNINI